MISLYIRLLNDMAERLKHIAKLHDISLNKLMFELSMQVLEEEDAKQRFLVAELRSNPNPAVYLRIKKPPNVATLTKFFGCRMVSDFR